jgi:hypothetical protein
MEGNDEFVDDPAIAAFAAATVADQDLQAVIGIVRARCPPSKLPPQHPARPYASVLDELSISSAGILVLRGTRIVVPKTLRPQVVRALHASHAGITKTLLHARQRYLWPYMANDIKTVIDACEACQKHRQGPHFEPEVKRVASCLMEAVSVDLMEVKGIKYLVMVDRFSSYPLVKVVRSATTASITKILSSWFNGQCVQPQCVRLRCVRYACQVPSTETQTQSRHSETTALPHPKMTRPKGWGGSEVIASG